MIRYADQINYPDYAKLWLRIMALYPIMVRFEILQRKYGDKIDLMLLSSLTLDSVSYTHLTLPTNREV